MSAGDLVYLTKDASRPITLKAKEYEVFTIIPVKETSNGIAFAPIGLTEMFNSGAAIKEVNYEQEKPGTVHIKVRSCGSFGAYSSSRPKMIEVDEVVVEFGYEEASGLVTFPLPIPEKEMYHWNVAVQL